MPDPVAFRAHIRSAGGGGAYVVCPFDVEAAFGRKRVPVRATIDGAEYRGSLVRHGSPEHILIVRKDLRQRIGKGVGDEVEVVVALDDEPREVEMPPALAHALDAHPEARAAFERLAYSHRREYAEWIGEAKRPETRERRAASAVERLLAA